MKIILLGHEDIASLIALDRLIRRLPEHQFDVFYSGSLASTKGIPDALAELVRVDTEFCGAFLTSASPAILNARLLQRPNDAKSLAMVRRLKPDLIVSIRYRRILKSAVIAIPKYGVINLHSGLLPDYRGVMATFWAMLNDEPEIGCTLHRIVDCGIDTGPVIRVSRMQTAADKSYLANVLGLYVDGVEMLADAIDAIAAGNAVPGTRQIEAGGHYYSTPEADDILRFVEKGLILADASELKSHIWQKKSVGNR